MSDARQDVIALPKCSIVVTHYNMAKYLPAALKSACQQTVPDFEIIIVDDCSDRTEWQQVIKIVDAFEDADIMLIRHEVNRGQISAMATGIEIAQGEFVAFLDPDDVYEPNFLEVLLNAHLNGQKLAAVASCEMGRFRIGGGQLSRFTRGFSAQVWAENSAALCEEIFAEFGFSRYFAPWEVGWFWSTTSGMLFRKDALDLLTPGKGAEELKVYGDAYYGFGAHMMGGSLFVDQVLSWRGVRSDNTAYPDRLFSDHQRRPKLGFVNRDAQLKRLAVEAMLRNGAHHYFTVPNFCEIVTAHLNAAVITEFASENPALEDALSRFAANVDWDA